MQFIPLTADVLDSAPPWMTGADLHPDRWRDLDTRSVLALEDAEPVAAGMLWTSRAHDSRYWFIVVVDPQRRRRGIGTSVVQELSRMRRLPIEFITRGYEGDLELAFADGLGARTIQVVPPARVETSMRHRLRASDAAIGGDQVPLEVLTAANAASYRWTHATWSPVAEGFEQVLADEVREDADLAATSLVLGGDGHPLALSVVYDDSPFPVITAETVRRDVADGERLVGACLRRSLDVLAGRGTDVVALDGHVSDPHLLPNWTRLEPTGRWLRLVAVPAGAPPTG